MPATKQQQHERLAAAKAIIAASGGRATVDDQESRAATVALLKKMAKELAGQFAHENMKLQTARQYIAKALRQLRGEVVVQKRGGRREGGGLPTGTRKCKNCGTWNTGVAPNNEMWQCPECEAIHPAKIEFLIPGEAFSIKQTLQDAFDSGLIVVED